MDLLEHQGKQYLRRWGIETPEGYLAESVSQVIERCTQIGYPAAIKAQVPFGGRGQLGGVRLANDENQAREYASAILGMVISGHRVDQVWVEEGLDIASEHYISFSLDRTERAHLAMVSASGGVNIEKAALHNPSALKRHLIEPLEGLSHAQACELAVDAGFGLIANEQAVFAVSALYRCYVEGDADLVEVNPLVLTRQGSVVAVDAKIVLDDNASFRHPEWSDLGNGGWLDPREAAAKERGLNYIGLSGSVGIIANGAGLAMTTLDLVAQAGGSAANFLDIGGGASAAVMAKALELVDSDPTVRAIFVNIFGGITRCDDVAQGIVEAVSVLDLKTPIVLRLEGTNAARGREILAELGSQNLVSIADMMDAAAKAVELASEMPDPCQVNKDVPSAVVSVPQPKAPPQTNARSAE